MNNFRLTSSRIKMNTEGGKTITLPVIHGGKGMVSLLSSSVPVIGKCDNQNPFHFPWVNLNSFSLSENQFISLSKKSSQTKKVGLDTADLGLFSLIVSDSVPNPWHSDTDPDPYTGLADPNPSVCGSGLKDAKKNSKFFLLIPYCVFKDNMSLSSHKTVEIMVYLDFYACWWKDPDPHKIIINPYPWGPKTYGSWSLFRETLQ